MFDQVLVPGGSLFTTVLWALVPLVALLFLLAVLRMSAWLATLLVSAVSIPLAVMVWGAPADGTLHAYFYGGLQGVWVIDWITFWGLIIFNTLVSTGDFERFKNWMVHQATADVRIQTIMLAWAFGALLEGLVGFGYPWAVVVPILVGLGIVDLDAIRVAALANNAPVSYGALGAPILALAAVTGLPLMALSASVGHIVAVLALLPPWVLIYLVTDWEGVREAWPLAIVASLSYIAGQWPVATYLGPYLPDLSGALVSFWVLFFFVKVWRPRTIRGFGGKPLQASAVAAADGYAPHATVGEGLKIWLPYIVLIGVVVAWTGPWSHLPGISLLQMKAIAVSSVTHQPISSTFNFNPLSGGTSILAAWLLIVLIVRPSGADIRTVFARTFHQMWGALLVGFFIFGVAYVFVYAGMANSLAYGLSKIGPWFVVLAPVLGWIGVALSGSNTSTNAMFGPVQAVTGRLLNLPILLLPSFNSVGAEVGKPIAPQTASIGVATTKYCRSEGQVIRHNMGWTFIMLGYLILISLLFYLVFPNVMML
ncbi:MAG TPA: L-lactate permease [Vicinamibacterales bacterium]|nr:L-lactate permease [Vicinamibacterales bacterium]